MSARALQRVAVRMLYDQAFLQRVYDDVEAATEDCDITDEERAWLRTPDRRAWQVDPLRRSRSLAALVEEFAVSVALFVRSGPAGTARLDSFFSSSRFHRGMQKGESLAQIFAQWFHDQSVPRDLLELEAALARVRRMREAGVRQEVDAPLSLAAAVEVLVLEAGTVSTFGSVLGTLRQGSVAERALDLDVDLPTIGSVPGDHEGVLVDGRSPDPKLEILSGELAQVLKILGHGVTWEAFVVEASRHGAEEEDCRSIVASFSADGLVVQA